MKIILGSGSPRRSQLLSELGYSFKIIKPEIDESIEEHWDFSVAAENLAIKKSEALLGKLQVDEVLICADTVVVHDHTILGKPVNKPEAIAMLSALSGKCHDVITGVSLRNTHKHISFSEKTNVCFSPLSIQEIENFKPFDKAGSYGIQEWIGLISVEKIVGSYTNVIGLPTSRLFLELKNFK